MSLHSRATDLRFGATYLAAAADEHAATVTRPQVPAAVPPGVRITLLADYGRARDAAELTQLIAWGTVSWESDYAHLSFEEDPQTAAAERALDEARTLLRDYRTALSRAVSAAPWAA
jgi:hypothetical protein